MGSVGTEEAAVVKGLEFGVVRFTQGDLKDKLGFYDDDDADNCIVYLGVPLLSESIEVDSSWLEQVSDEEASEWTDKHMHVLNNTPINNLLDSDTKD